MSTSLSSARCLWLSICSLNVIILAYAVPADSVSNIDAWNPEEFVDDMSLLQVQHEIAHVGRERSSHPAADQRTANSTISIDSAAKVDTSVRDKLISAMVNDPEMLMSAINTDRISKEHGAIQTSNHSTEEKLISAMVNDPEMLMSAISIDSAVNVSTEHGAIQTSAHTREEKLISAMVNDPEMLMSAISISSVAHVNAKSVPTWVPITVVGILSVIVIGFAIDSFSGHQYFGNWLKDVVLFDLPTDRRNSYYLFGLALAISLATLQFAGPLRTAIFLDVVGADKEPIAKSMVLLVLLPIVMLYSVAVTALPSTRVLVIAVNAFYTVIFLLLTVMIQSTDKPAAWVAWALYFAVETKGVILMPMIWSVIADVSTTELSKKAYPFTFFVMQIGGIGGSTVAIFIEKLGGQVGLMWMQTLTLAVIGACTWGGVSVIQSTPEAEVVLPTPKQPQDSAESEASLMDVALKRLWEGGEGLWLLLSRPYVFMCFFVSYATLVTRTVMDYENAILVKAANPDPNDQIVYWGRMMLTQNVLIAIIALVGTRQLIELLNISKVLALLPIVSIACVAALCVDYTLFTSTISCIFASTVAYALNSPCKEILFVRTSRDIKYKAKSWSEMYGNNLMKILGAQINLWVNNEKDSCFPSCFQPVPTFVVSAGWVVLWLFIALTVGWQFQRLDAKNDIIT